MNEINIWKLLTIIFIIIIVGFFVNMYIERQQTYNFGDIKITKNQIENFAENVGDPFIICNIAGKNCVRIGKINT